MTPSNDGARPASQSEDAIRAYGTRGSQGRKLALFRAGSLLSRSSGGAFAALMTLTSCQSPAKPYLTMGKRIADAGFVAHPANTTARYAMMNSLPPGVMTYRPSPAGLVYLYADPIGCGCVYMGSDVAFVYLLNSSPIVKNQHVPIKNVPSVAEMAAENRRDTSGWDWSAWSNLADPGPTQPRYVSGAAW